MAKQAEVIILGQEYCPVCEETKERVKKDIKAGKVKFIDIDGPEGEEYDAKFKISYTPFFLKLNEKTGKYKKAAMYNNPDGSYFFK